MRAVNFADPKPHAPRGFMRGERVPVGMVDGNHKSNAPRLRRGNGGLQLPPGDAKRRAVFDFDVGFLVSFAAFFCHFFEVVKGSFFVWRFFSCCV